MAATDLSIRIEFGPNDPLNPQFGYVFRATTRKGVEMFTGSHPETGEPLTPHDCIALAETFFGPDPADNEPERDFDCEKDDVGIDPDDEPF